MVKGSCLCGACRYRAEGPWKTMTHCHCSRCRKHHGAAFATMVGTAADGFAWEAGSEHVRLYASGAPLPRWYCELCGSKLPARESRGDTAWVTAGTLDDDCGVRPVAHIFAGSAAPWFTITDTLRQFEDAPPGYPTSMPTPVPPEARPGVVEGGCLCGSVRYAVEGEVGPFYHCHCSRCRKARGAAFASNLFVAASQLSWLQGADRVRVFDLPGAARFGQDFCGDCGGAVPRLMRAFDGYSVPAGGLDHDPGLRPSRHIFVASKAPWYELTDGLPRFAERAS